MTINVEPITDDALERLDGPDTRGWAFRKHYPAIRARIAEQDTTLVLLMKEKAGETIRSLQMEATIAQQAQRIAALENLLTIQSAQLTALREPPIETETRT